MKKTARTSFAFFIILLPIGLVYGQARNSGMNEPIIIEAIVPQNILSSIMFSRYGKKIIEDLEPLRKSLIQWASRCSVEPTDPKIIKFLNSQQPHYEIMQAIPTRENNLRPLVNSGGMIWFISWTKGLINYSRSLPKDKNILNQMYETTAKNYLARLEELATVRKMLPSLSTGEQYVSLPVEIYVPGGEVSGHSMNGESVSMYIDGKTVRGTAGGVIKTGEDERAQAKALIKEILDSFPELTMQLLVLQTKCQK